jgi:hypothetical protein
MGIMALSPSSRATNKFLRCSRYQRDIPKTSTPVPPSGFSRVARARCNGRVLTASAIHCTRLTAETASAIAR